MPRVRTAVAGLAAGTLLLGAAAPAAAQSTTTIGAGQAGTAAITLSLAGTDVLTIAESLAAAVPGEAAASATPLAIGGEGLSALSVESDGATVADDACATPEVPSPLDTLLDGGLACADVSASGDDQAASAVAGVANAGVLNLAGGDLGPLNELLATLSLDEALALLEAELATFLEDGDLLAGLRDGCIDLLDALDDGGLIGDLLDLLTDTIDTLTDETDLAIIGDALDEVLAEFPDEDLLLCEVLGDLADTLLADGLVGSLTSLDLVAALEGATAVLDVTLLSTASEVALDGDDLVALAGPGDGAIELALSLPLDDLLGDLLTGAVDDAVAPLLEAIEGVIVELGGAVEDVPVVGEIVAPLLTTGDIGALLDGDLLEIAVAPGEALATGDLEAQDTDGLASPALVGLGGGLLSLPELDGLDESLNAAAGLLDDQLLAALRDPPLVDVLSISLVDGDVVDDEVFGLPGTTATSGTASVALLGVLGDPLLALDVAPATASVGVGVVTDGGDDDDPIRAAGPDAGPLPVTGSGVALLGLLALGAAGTLRRRD